MRPLPAAILVGLVGCGAGYAVAIPATGELEKALIAAATGLLFTGLLGGVLKLLLDDFVRERERRQEEVRFTRQVLEDLKAAYYAFERARTLILAHGTTEIYDEQMPNVIDACTKLRAVQRALQGQTPTDEVGKMGDYLQDVIREYREHRLKGPSLLADEDRREAGFAKPLDQASATLRAELARLLPAPRRV